MRQVIIGLVHKVLSPDDIAIIMAFEDFCEELRASDNTDASVQVSVAPCLCVLV